MDYRRIKDQDKEHDAVRDDIETSRGKPHSVTGSANSIVMLGGSSSVQSKWKRKSAVTLALTVLTSSQAILIVWSKRAGKYEYSVTTANFLVEALKCALSLAALTRIWRNEGVTEDNRLSTSWDEVNVFPIPAALYLIKNLLQYYIFAYVDAPGYQILKNLNIISTGILYRIILKKQLSEIQWAAFILLCAGCTTAQLNSNSDRVLQTPFEGWVMAIVMALLSGFAGVYTEAIIKKRPSRNINVQNFWLYVFGMAFNAIAILVQDFDAVMNKGFFHGYSLVTVLMILNHALSGIAVSMVMKYADNIVKIPPNAPMLPPQSMASGLYLFLQYSDIEQTMQVPTSCIMAEQVYSTSVAMLLTAVLSVFLFGFHLSLAFFLGSTSDRVLQTPFEGWVMAIVMALLSGFAGVYTEAIIKKRPSRNINVQNFWLYVFGMAFNAIAILVQDFDAVMNKGFFHGYSLVTVLMILNHALRYLYPLMLSWIDLPNW
ncbi:unnamed protein product [Fraxinus pennsylvanica]|uniref:CMP-sialic acid transporter 4 n=1 Tax=Fraxinus pennsylvanica TaxID=56036 RepID=A0AAD2E5K8_9LAMI|nr:unnamed protein product [Fraxinus pennsylvanica]